MKKCCGIAVLCLLVFAVFCACAGKNTNSEVEEQQSEEIEENMQNDAESVTSEKESDIEVKTEDPPADTKENVQEGVQSKGDVKSEEVESEAGVTVNTETKTDTDTYKKLVGDAFSGFDGTLSYGIHMYNSGETHIHNNGRMKAASIIKLYVMEYAYDMMQKNEISGDDIVSGTKISSLIERMITVSDNDAANILIKHFGMDKINGYITSRYPETTLQRKMLDYDAAARGEENYTSVADVMKYLDTLYNNRETYPYNEMLNIMKRQQISTKLRRNMPQGVKIASKTGELSDVENDVAIVFSDKGDYAIVCLTKGGDAATARNAMAKACRSVYDELQK